MSDERRLQSRQAFRQAFWRAFREADSIRLRQWERSSVTLPQLRVLYSLRRRPGSTTGELARRLGITVSTTSGLVIKLVDRGLVARGSLADDRRQAPLSLTDEGAGLLGELSDEARSFLGSVADRLGDDLDEVTQALERLAEAGAFDGENFIAASPAAPPGAPSAATPGAVTPGAVTPGAVAKARTAPAVPVAAAPAHDAPALAGDDTAPGGASI